MTESKSKKGIRHTKKNINKKNIIFAILSWAGAIAAIAFIVFMFTR